MNDKTSKTFYCLYCQSLHPIECISEEHIIPKFLFNKNHTLKNVCKKVNNYMANSFEKRILQMELFKELLLFFKPPEKPVYRGEIITNLDLQTYRYILPSGKHELTQHPAHSKTNFIQIPIRANSGLLLYNLKLPFRVIEKIKGVSRMANKIQEHSESDKKEIFEYLKQLEANPSLNKDFEKYLKDVDGIFTFSDVAFKLESVTNPKIASLGRQALRFEVDYEILFKLFLKIAWTHSAKQFGLDWTSNKLSKWIISYLSSGHIEDKDYKVKYPELFFEPVKIEENDYTFWKPNIEKSFKLIKAIPISKDREKLLIHHQKRVDEFAFANQFISYADAVEFDVDNKSQKEELSYHELSFYNAPYGDTEITICSISLFGGIFDVHIQVAGYPVQENYTEIFRVSF
jgi:hypothetical protein